MLTMRELCWVMMLTEMQVVAWHWVKHAAWYRVMACGARRDAAVATVSDRRHSGSQLEALMWL
jgi:hypothetical protein